MSPLQRRLLRIAFGQTGGPPINTTYTGFANPVKEGSAVNVGDTWGRTAGTPINIILDTDISSDVDDLMDVKACTIYHNEGMARLLGVAVTTSRGVSPGAAKAAMTYWGQGSIPVASYAPLGTFDPGAPPTNYLDTLYKGYHAGVNLAASCTDTTTAIGTWLTASSGNVQYVMTGFAKGLRAFLSASGANMTLFAAKVQKVVAVAGIYPNDGGSPEFNLAQNAADWNWLNANCPVPIHWCGIELGNTMGSVGGAYLTARQGPQDLMVVALASSFAWSGSRTPWGVIGVVYAINPAPFGYATVNGVNAIDASTGSNTFTAGAGTQKYLTLTGPNMALVKAHIQALVAADGVTGTKTWDGNVWLDAGEAPYTGVHAYNMGRANYFSGTFPTIDRMKFCGGFAAGSGYTVDADNWFTIAPGGFVQVNLCLGMGPQGYFPPGAYKVTSATGITLSVPASDGLSSISADAVNTVTFTAGTASDWTAFHLAVVLTNNTGSPIHVTDVRVFLASQESLLNSGEIFDPVYLAAHAGAKVLRFKDWQFQDEFYLSSRVRVFADYGSQSEGKLSYGPGSWCPISIMVKLAKKLGADCWLCMPTGSFTSKFSTEVGAGGTTVFRAIYQDPFSGFVERDPHLPNGTRVRLNVNAMPANLAPLVGRHDYYVVNSSPPTFQIAETVGGTPLTLTSVPHTVPENEYVMFNAHSNRDPYTDLWLPILQAAHDADSSVRIWVEYGNEVWNSNYENWGFTKDVATNLSGVTDPSQFFIGIGYAYMSLQAWKAAETIYASDVSKITPVFGCQTSGGILAFDEATNFIDPGFLSAGTRLQEILVARKSRAVYACAPYFSQDDGAGHFFPGGFSAAAAYAKNGNSTTYSDAFWRQTFVGDLTGVGGYNGVGVLGAKVWMDQTRDDVRSRFPGVPIVFYEYGHQSVMPTGGASGTITNLTALSLLAFLDSNAGRDLYQYADQQLVKPYKVRANCHYWSVGGAQASAAGFNFWGLQNTPVDTPRSAWFRSL